MSGPIDPNDMLLAHHIPEEVFEVFNKLIVANWDGKFATVVQKDVVDLVVAQLGIPRDQIFNKCFLDIEDHYRKAGWKVYYDKPGYNEDYEASFLFSKNPAFVSGS